MAARLRRHAALRALARTLRPGTPGVGRRLAAISRMLGATFRGEYDGRVRLLLIAVSGAYVVSPIDAVPEMIFAVFGLVDDAAVATYLVGALLDETERFLEWEKRRHSRRGPAVPRAPGRPGIAGSAPRTPGVGGGPALLCHPDE